MIYDYTHYKLHKDPLAVVLAQVRFSRVRKMGEFIPTIQNRLRRAGYPEDASGVFKQISLRVEPGQPGQPQITEQKRDEFRSKDNRWSLTVAEDMIAVVTTAYDRFADFLAHLEEALQIVDEIAEIHHGQVHRVGLRYVDVIDPEPGETFRDYLQGSLHGPRSSVFTGPDQLMHLESIGRTDAGHFILRITQNDQGVLVPPDIYLRPMVHKQQVARGKLLTLVDSDHFAEGTWDYDLPSILETLDTLHAGINKAWLEDIISPHALEAWGAERVTV